MFLILIVHFYFDFSGRPRRPNSNLPEAMAQFDNYRHPGYLPVDYKAPLVKLEVAL